MLTCDVYLARLRDLEDRHATLLDERESRRRAQFRADDDQNRFTLAAALLRAVIGQRTGTDAADVVIDRHCESCGADHGRPLAAERSIKVSVTHSGEVVAVAVTDTYLLGVDVEAVIALRDDAIVPFVCAPAERRFLRTPRDFYVYWTRKEALLKASGEGLRIPMTDLLMTPPGRAPSLIARAGASPPPCQMADLPIGDGYAGAVAVLANEPVAFAFLDGSSLLSRL